MGLINRRYYNAPIVDQYLKSSLRTVPNVIDKIGDVAIRVHVGFVESMLIGAMK